MNGQDIQIVLSGKVRLVDSLRAKKEALNLYSEPYISSAQISSKAPL